MTVHCSNFDDSYIGCRECPGQLEVKRRDGTVEMMCRAGERYIRELIASSELPTLALTSQGERTN